MAYGKMFFDYLTSSAGGDLVEQIETAVNETEIRLAQVSLISDTDITVSINGGYAGKLYLDTDSKYKLSIPADTILVNSMVVAEAGASIWVAAQYQV